jgi:hypothetical protein
MIHPWSGCVASTIFPYSFSASLSASSTAMIAPFWIIGIIFSAG